MSTQLVLLLFIAPSKSYLSKKTMVLIAMLNYYYWCPNKDDLYKMYLNNNEKYEKEIAEMRKNLKLYSKKTLFYLALKSNLRHFYILDI